MYKLMKSYGDKGKKKEKRAGSDHTLNDFSRIKYL